MTNIRKNLLKGLLVTAIVLGAVGSVFAGTLTFNGSLDGSDALHNRVFGCGSISGTGTSVYYDAYTIEVSATGSYQLETTLGSIADTVLVLYSPSFNAGSPMTNCLEYNDDISYPTMLNSRINTTLTANIPYVVVVTSFGNGDTGSYTLTIDGPGSVCLNTCTPATVTNANLLPEPFTTDGRINGYDSAAPVAVYGQDMVGGRGLVIYSDEGALLVTIAPDLLVAPTDGNQLIASNESAQVYVFMQPDGQWHVQAWTRSGKWYHLMTDMMYAHSVNYSSWEE